MKRHYLVAYDYGQGAVWSFIAAESPETITRMFPDFSVVDPPPDWMTEQQRKEIAAKMTFDLDHPTGWLASVLELRRKK